MFSVIGICTVHAHLDIQFSWYRAIFCRAGNIVQAAFWYGLVVHFRIYPIIYALPIVLVLDPHSFQSGQKPCLVNWKSSQDNASHGRKEVSEVYGVLTALKTIFTRGRIMFAMVSGSVFMLCTGLFFYLYRWEFLNEALLYHLTRTDPRHNFSIYFYHIYLHVEHEFSVVEKLISFLPQLIVQLVLIIRFAQDLPFCLFLQTVAFVAFNKVRFSHLLQLYWIFICYVYHPLSTRTHDLHASFLLIVCQTSFLFMYLFVFIALFVG